jgi:hypothetical protein
MTERMNDLQALVTGAIAGALMCTEQLLIDVRVPTDDQGNYLPEVEVVGRESGVRLRVRVEVEALAA